MSKEEPDKTKVEKIQEMMNYGYIPYNTETYGLPDTLLYELYAMFTRVKNKQIMSIKVDNHETDEE